MSGLRSRLTRVLLLAALLLAPRAALAEPSDSQADSEADAEPAPEPERTEGSVEWRFAWDDAPTYEVWLLTPKLQHDDKLGVVKDLGVVGRVGGSLFVDGGFASGKGLGNAWEIELRRLRIETLGRISYGIDTRYKFSFGAEDGNFYLNDFWFSWLPGRWIERVRFGYIDPPFSLQALASSQGRSFMETAAPVGAFAPGYRLGLEVRDRLEDFNLSWIASLSSVGQSQAFSDASDSPFRFSLRGIWQPGGISDDSAVPLNHVAAAVGYSFSGSGDVQYRARPESSLSPFLVDTGKIPGDATQLGLELARRVGPLTLQGEWIGSFVSSSEVGSHFFSGLYFQAAYAVTGEIRPYDPRSGLFKPMDPLTPFSWEHRKWGGLEVAARLSWVDLSDREIHGGRMTTLNAAAIWSLNRFARIHFDGIYASVKDRPRLGGNFIAQMRLELTM